MIQLGEISNFKKLYLLLTLSILFFLFKGIQYALIGSFMPIIFIAFVVFLLLLSLKIIGGGHHRVVKIWAGFLIFWSIMRLVLSVVLLVDNNLTEAHLREQFTLEQQLISLFVGLVGYYMFRLLRLVRKTS